MLNIKLERVVINKNSYQEELAINKSIGLLGKEAHNHWGGVKEGDLSKAGHVVIDLFNDMKSYSKYKESTMADFDKEGERVLFKMGNFSFKKGSIFVLGNQIVIGSDGVKDAEDWRQLGFDTIKFVRKTFPNASYAILNRLVNKDTKQFFEGMYLSEYKFDKYKSVKKVIRDLTLLVSGELDKDNMVNDRTDIFKTIKEAKQKVNAQFLARDWVNTTPEDANSKTITEDIVDKFKDNKSIDVVVYEKKELEKMRMNGHLTVNRASKFEPKVVRITYTPKDFVKNKDNKIIVGVGKGLTYDSGGLSIKPGASMTTMKADKGGAMALFGLADILAKRGANNKVVLYLAFAENMISPDAYRPDDVVVFRNGKTAHIKNTDAEGRVVIFDSLCLAQDQNPDLDEIFSIATLTGAAVYQ